MSEPIDVQDSSNEGAPPGPDLERELIWARLLQEVSSLPALPGVYRYFDAKGDVQALLAPRQPEFRAAEPMCEHDGCLQRIAQFAGDLGANDGVEQIIDRVDADEAGALEGGGLTLARDYLRQALKPTVALTYALLLALCIFTALYR